MAVNEIHNEASMAHQYDYLIVGAGLYGATFAEQMHKAGKKVIVIDKRNHVAGNIYTEAVEGIQIHRYGAHIFHTNCKEVWNYIQQFALFNNFINSNFITKKNKKYVFVWLSIYK